MQLFFFRTATFIGMLIAATGVQAQSVITDQLGRADLTRGEKLFKKCSACHTVDKAGKNKIGPGLYGIVGRDVASTENYKYSKAMRGFGGVWTPERLAEFLTKPRKAVKGTRMGFSGLKKPDDRLNLIAYLNGQSETPVTPAKTDTKLPEKAPEKAETEAELEIGILVAGKGAETTFNTCSACHSERVVAYQGLTREGWDEMLVWMVEEQEMDEPEADDRKAILDYLESNYNIDRPNFPKPIQ